MENLADRGFLAALERRWVKCLCVSILCPL